MLNFEDFVPEMVEKGGLFKTRRMEAFASAVERAGEFCSNPHVTIITVETVVLPNIHSDYEAGSTDPSLSLTRDSGSDWHQFVRVWFTTE